MAKPKKTELQRYCELRGEKKALESRARALAKEIDLLTDTFLTYLETLNKDSAKVQGYQITVEEGNARVSWSDEYLKLAGAEAAAELSANAPRSAKLTVIALN